MEAKGVSSYGRRMGLLKSKGDKVAGDAREALAEGLPVFICKLTYAAEPNSGGLTQQVDGATGWVPDTAHQPDLSYVPYLLTGERWMLDNLNAMQPLNVVTRESIRRIALDVGLDKVLRWKPKTVSWSSSRGGCGGCGGGGGGPCRGGHAQES